MTKGNANEAELILWRKLVYVFCNSANLILRSSDDSEMALVTTKNRFLLFSNILLKQIVKNENSLKKFPFD